MVRDITLGQYFPGNSPLHRMDPRAKIVLLVAFIVFIFVGQNFYALALMTVSVLAVVVMTGVPAGMYFKSLKMILFVILFTAVLNLFYGSGQVLWQWGFLRITQGGVNNAIFIAVRIASLILISSSLTFTTSPTDLTDGLERLLKPLTVFHIKVHDLAMMMTIALRFVPTLLEETDKIMSAQKARGADMESGGLIQRVKALIPILVPLFVSSFRRAYDLAMAMECRCYRGGQGRTRMKQLHLTAVDVWAVVLTAAVCAGVILLNIFMPSIWA
ncbi:MAG TPA: energy-coupling factor transporter transmembrane protein EcfT [Candidatus Gallacutalibacter stercoravium]|nr:energy-coupling factor transporter transmembrane protein EcfT [Candidatus Gallacutalibacter stercoravium]